MPDPSHERERREEAFLNLLDGLNPEQRAAVDQTEGPVLVVAGPGTGKTHILAARIGRILLHSDTAPHNILCLTFTNAGVRAMRERLLRFIGPEAHRVHIHTFHSFASQIIQDNLYLFGRQDLQPLSDLERIQVIRQLIDQLDVDNPLKRGRYDPYYFEPHLTALFSQMKREDWRPETVEERIDRYLADLPNREEYRYQRGNRKQNRKKGDLKVDKVKKQTERMENLRQGARLFPVYQQKLRAERRYDYEDMILKVLVAFRAHPSLLRRYQEQYLYFLVDEFQDTNGAQYELLQCLADYWDVPNVFIVGDDDQSIYEFQGARLHNLTDFFRRYESQLRMVVLRENYRSTQAILDGAGALIRNNRIRLVHQAEDLRLNKKLVAALDFPAGTPAPRLLRFPDRLAETAGVVGQIEALLAGGTPAEEIAVIYARHRQVDRLKRMLHARGIDHHARQEVDLLRLPVIAQVRDMLAFLDRETRLPGSGDPQLFRMMHYRAFGIPPADILTLAAWRRRREDTEAGAWRQALRAALGAGGPDLEAPDALQQLLVTVEDWIAQRHQLGLPALLERVINRSGLLRWAFDHPDRPLQMGALKTFTDHLREECRRDPRLDLTAFLERLTLMEEHRIALRMDRESVRGTGVQLVTAHSAKGLEFDHVFLFDADKSNWEGGGASGRNRFALPDTLTYSGEEDALEARRRLFYVALTRARRGLTVSCSRARADGRELEPCRFVDEWLESGVVSQEEREPDGEQLLAAQSLYLAESGPPRLNDPGHPATGELLDQFALSVSALNSYLRCPLAFYFTYVLRAPSSSSETALYGNAAHEALQRLFEGMKRARDRVFPPVERLVTLFEAAMRHRRALFAPPSFDRFLERGRRDLRRYYAEHHEQWPTRVQVERGVWRVDFEGIPLQGVIDRVDELEGGTVRILDYKTGSAMRAHKYRARPSDRRPEGGAHWRQMVFYKILFERADPQGRRVEEAVLSYLEPDPDGRRADVAVAIEPGDTDRLAAMLRETYARIQAHDFFEGCGEDRCPWCAFARDHHADLATLSDPELESLDDNLTL